MADEFDEINDMIANLQSQIDTLTTDLASARDTVDQLIQTVVNTGVQNQQAILASNSNAQAITQNTNRISDLAVMMPTGVDINSEGAEWTHMISLDTQGYFTRDAEGRAILHRDDEPAVVKFHPERDHIIEERYFLQGVPHRLNGPGHILRDRASGREISRTFFINGTNFGSQICNRTTGAIESESLRNGGRNRWISEGGEEQMWEEFIAERDIL